jgi:hypothetical protein
VIEVTGEAAVSYQKQRLLDRGSQTAQNGLEGLDRRGCRVTQGKETRETKVVNVNLMNKDVGDE